MIFFSAPRQSLELSLEEVFVLAADLFQPNKKKIKKFEKKFAHFIGTKHAVSFTSLRSGFYQTLKSLGFSQNDEIILPAYGFYIIPAIIIMAGLKPVFVDINPRNYTIDPEKIEKVISSKTRAIVATHLNGYPANMEKIMQIAQRHKLRVIEDCAHACGSEFKGNKLGSFDIGCFSFGTGKNLTTLGGGMITTNDSGLAKELNKSRIFPEKERLYLRLKILTRAITMRLLTFPLMFLITGYPLLLLSQFTNLNFLLNKLEEKIKIPQKPPVPIALFSTQAKLGIKQLKHLKKQNQARTNNASLYNRYLVKLKHAILPQPKSGKNIYAHYPIKIENVNKFIKKLALRRIDIQKDYCSACNELKIFKSFKTYCPVAKGLEGKLVYLPNHPSLNENAIKYISENIKKILN